MPWADSIDGGSQSPRGMRESSRPACSARRSKGPPATSRTVHGRAQTHRLQARHRAPPSARGARSRPLSSRGPSRGERGREQRGGHEDGDEGDEQPAEHGGAQLVERHEEQGEEADRHRQAGECHRAARVPRRLGRGLLRRGARRARFAEAAHGQERVVDPDGEADHRGDVDGEDRERKAARGERDEAERQAHGQGAGGHGEQRGHDRAERQEKQCEGEGKGAALGTVGVVGARAPQVEVQGGLPVHRSVAWVWTARRSS